MRYSRCVGETAHLQSCQVVCETSAVQYLLIHFQTAEHLFFHWCLSMSLLFCFFFLIFVFLFILQGSAHGTPTLSTATWTRNSSCLSPDTQLVSLQMLGVRRWSTFSWITFSLCALGSRSFVVADRDGFNPKSFNLNV